MICCACGKEHLLVGLDFCEVCASPWFARDTETDPVTMEHFVRCADCGGYINKANIPGLGIKLNAFRVQLSEEKHTVPVCAKCLVRRTTHRNFIRRMRAEAEAAHPLIREMLDRRKDAS